MFVLRKTDLVVKDVMPLALTRTYRQWDNHSRAFGMGANHPYDICPLGSRNPYTFEDGRGHILLRNSYEDGRISKQIAADGSIYHYHYHYTLDRDDQVVKTLVVSPEGVESALTFDHGMLVGRTASRGL